MKAVRSVHTSTRPALIPQPRQLQWGGKALSLPSVKSIVLSDSVLLPLTPQLAELLALPATTVPVLVGAPKGPYQVRMELGRVAVPDHADEAYRLRVTEKEIYITANTAHGVFNGLQTLRQLVQADRVVAASITDWPAFGWRGFMTDAGRNYQPMELLREQIAVMGRYKLNVFHFHITEDIAWRLAVAQYPQLTLPQHMLRDPGKYYSEADLKSLIAYCKERYIELVPEIDMPGHSAAFSRAMGFDMQSDSGLLVVQDILRSLCATYDLRYVHVGGDEVKITNPDFMPAVTGLLHSLGKETVGWSPGAALPSGTLRQLWMGDELPDSGVAFIDSRHLYLNHMDPLEAVVTLFHRRIGGAGREDAVARGATLCVWPDRRVAAPDDILRQNPVYPGMLAFAERTWQGGGSTGMITNSRTAAEQLSFKRFEDALLEHRSRYFVMHPFPYARQSQLQWSLYGPYHNEGNTDSVFAPERGEQWTQAPLQVQGGTVVLRHWWHPVVQGILPHATPNTTWYATTRLWADKAGYRPFWIGFNNLSRSPATDSPPEGNWTPWHSTLWVNGAAIAPPKWQHGGRKGNPEEPLVDEGYEYRAPTRIYLRQGWNEVMIKAPVGSFKGTDWQNPVKWMFTFVPVPE